MPPPTAFVSADGYRVELIQLQHSLRQPPTAALRVTWPGYWLRDCCTVLEVAQLVDLAALTDAAA